MTDTSDSHSDLTELCQILADWHTRGWSEATSTNASLRSGETDFLITLSGKDKGRLTYKDFMKVDQTGKPTEATADKPSAETALHALVYKHTEARCIVHSHSLESTLLSRAKTDFVTFTGWEMQKALAGESTHLGKVELAIFANSQDMSSLSQHIAESDFFAKTRWGFLLAGHGLYAWGRNIKEAKRHLEAYEFLSKLHLHSNPLQRS